MKREHYILSFVVFFILVAVIAIFGEPTKKPQLSSGYTIRYDTVERYYVDSVTHQLMNWKHEKVKYETINP